MENKSAGKRTAILAGITLTVAAVFLARLIQWQIVQAEMYADISGREVYTITGENIRGEIFDINGKPLAENLTSYRIVLNKLFISNDELNGIIAELTDITEKCGEKWTDVIPVITDKNGKFVFDDNNKSEVDSLINSCGGSDAQEVLKALTEKYGCRDYPPETGRKIASVRYNMEKMAYSREKPYIFADSISESSMAIISEKMSGVKGVSVESAARRTYINGSAAPHIVGITGLISQEEYEELSGQGYSYTDIIGKSGIEAAFETELRGASGKKIYEEDEAGNIALVRTEPAKPGSSIYLTIDSDLQLKAQQEAIKQANDYAAAVNDESMGADCHGAAAVVLNVKDFSVLCAASCPGYDLERYYSDYESLAGDEASPLFDRAFAGALAPGSTFKPLTASAALQEGKLDSHTRITCSGVYTEGGLRLWCMGYHGDQELDSAMVNSCNVFFAEAGRRLGIELLDKYAVRCGLGVKTGVEIYESAGTLAGPEFSSTMGTKWYSTMVSPAAIGQSDNQFTPLQLAAYAATIANDGTRLKTHVVDRIVSADGKTVIKTRAQFADSMRVSPKNLNSVKKAMLHAAESYGPLADYPIKVAGKTGTAENSGSDHANFICFAPYDAPQIAVAVMIEHGAKSYVAVTAAKKIMDAYFGVE